MQTRRFLPGLIVLFIGSGCAALIYEIVWFQLLELVIGSSAISLGILLGTFMGGMCLGSLLLPRVISARGHRRHHPARGRGRHLPAAADAVDGRDAAGDFAVGEGDARRRVVARLFLR